MKCTFHNYTSSLDITQAGLNFQDIYQTFEYANQEASRSGGMPCFFLFESDHFTAALPLIIHPIPIAHDMGMQLFDAISAYGYPGFVFNQPPSDDDLHDLFTSLIPVAARENIVSIFIRLHPWYNQFTIQGIPQCRQVVHGKTVYVDLKEPYQVISANYSSTHTRGIKSLVKKRFYTITNRWEDYPLFQEAYMETMQHVNAGKFYFFEKKYFDDLKRNLTDHLTLINAYDDHNNYTSGALYMKYGDIVQYHLGATLNAFRSQAPSKLIFDEAIRYFAGEGFHLLHLGGGVGSGEDSLFTFKSGFSPHILAFTTIRCITLEDAYQHLTKIHGNNISNTDINYFPLYRKS